MSTFATGGMDGLLVVWGFKRIKPRKRQRPRTKPKKHNTSNAMRAVPSLKDMRRKLTNPRIGSCTGHIFQRLPEDRRVRV